MRPKYCTSYLPMLLPVCVGLVMIFACMFTIRFKIILLMILNIILVSMLVFAAYGGYPELTDTELVCRNAVYRFWSRHYRYEDIEKVVYCSFGSTAIHVYLKGAKRRKGHAMTCMAGKDVDDFIAELRSKGVTVERPTTLRGQW